MNEYLNVLDFGAKGDGKTNDTAAIQAAIDKAAENKNTVFFPAGTYMCANLTLHAFVGLQGVCNWGYFDIGGSVLMLNDDKAPYLMDITNARCCTINGMSIDGNNWLGENIHGLYKNGANDAHKEDSYKIERCKVAHFSGDGIHLNRGWCYSIRHSMLCDNKGSGIKGEAVDGFLIDNWFSGNTGAGFNSEYWCSSTMFTGNRIEWNKKAGIFILYGAHFNFTGNYFDRSGGPGLSINTGDSPDVSHITVTGNIFNRNGASEKNTDTEKDCHLYIHKAKSFICTSNAFSASRDDGGKTGRISPNFGIIYSELEESIIKDNSWHNGVNKEFFVNKGGNKESIAVKDNFGCLNTSK